MSLRLWQIADKFRALESLETEGDLPPEVIRDTLESLEGEFEEKAVAVAHFIENLRAAVQSIENAATKMQARAHAYDKRAESLAQYLLLQMQVTNKKKVESDTVSITVRDNPGSVDVYDQSKVPPAYWRQPPVPPPAIDKSKIATDIKAGVEVPGAVLVKSQRVNISA